MTSFKSCMCVLLVTLTFRVLRTLNGFEKRGEKTEEKAKLLKVGRVGKLMTTDLPSDFRPRLNSTQSHT